jgi:hypothetical protein
LESIWWSIRNFGSNLPALFHWDIAISRNRRTSDICISIARTSCNKNEIESGLCLPASDIYSDSALFDCFILNPKISWNAAMAGTGDLNNV